MTKVSFLYVYWEDVAIIVTKLILCYDTRKRGLSNKRKTRIFLQIFGLKSLPLLDFRPIDNCIVFLEQPHRIKTIGFPLCLFRGDKTPIAVLIIKRF